MRSYFDTQKKNPTAQCMAQNISPKSQEELPSAVTNLLVTPTPPALPNLGCWSSIHLIFYVVFRVVDKAGLKLNKTKTKSNETEL